MTLDALTVELGELVAGATELPTSIDPVRPPAVPGCFVGPPSITPDAETGGRLLLAQWEVGALVPATLEAWETAARHGEHIAAAVIGHATLGLVDARSMLYPAGDGEVPGYRVDVAVLLHAGALAPIAPAVPPIDGAATMTAPATMIAVGAVVVPATIDGAATLDAPATLTATGTVVAVVTIDGATTMTAPAAMTAAGTVVAGTWTPAAIVGARSWHDATDLATITASAGAVSQWADKLTVGPYPLTQGTAANQPKTGIRTVAGKNVLDFDGTNDYLQNNTFTALGAAHTALAVVVADVALRSQGIASLGDSLTGSDFVADYCARLLWNQGDRWSAYYNSAERATIPQTNGTVYQVVATRNGGTWKMWANRVSGSGTTGSPTSAVTVPSLFVGADHYNGPVEYLGGAIGELVIVADEISAADRASWDDYCSAKWGTP